MMFRRMLALFVLIYLMISISAHAFEDKITHPKLTEAAYQPSISKIDNYLVNIIGFSLGVKSVLSEINRNGYINYNTATIEKWLQKGSTDEDDLNICRASNHFHNPIHSGDWLQSQMNDSPMWLDAFCGWTKRYSAVTWATGFTSPGDGYIGVRTGQYFIGTGLGDARQDMGWDDARGYFYAALTSTDPVVREDRFVKTFRAVGQVLHLLQDMAVPAHVRNDMESHLFNTPLWQILNMRKWMSNPFEKYVITNFSAINRIPVKPEFASSTKLTDFWDRNVYTGANPSEGKYQGLAEYANANYFSDFTIPLDKPSTSHTFPYPQITNTNYICTDTLPESGEMTKYVSRTPCPARGGPIPVDHFAAVSLLNNKGTSVTSLKKVWLDDNVHDTYAQQILPRAVGYSAALLDYFFRGTINLNQLVNVTDSGAIRLTATNTTANGDLMTNGTVTLVLRYRQISADLLTG